MTQLLVDALAISDAWRGLDLRERIDAQLRASHVLALDADIVAIGKAAREMSEAARDVLGARARRRLVIVDEGPAFSMDSEVEFVIGEHPLPGLGSLMAGERLVDFLDRPTGAQCTIFLVSGGASSLCALPQAPMSLEDLHELFAAVLESGADITTLNQLRAASSSIAGGAILRRVRTPRSLALIMVDNVVSGVRWVASGLTFDYVASRSEVDRLLAVVGRSDTEFAGRVLGAYENRQRIMSEPVTTLHENEVIAAPQDALAAVADEAVLRGYRVVGVGSDLHGDVADVVTQMTEALASNSQTEGPCCVVGVGEVTLRIHGPGTGGRCQDFAWRMAGVLDGKVRDTVVVARGTDGRDFVKGIAGGWVDTTTLRRARELGIDWTSVVDNSDSHHALAELGQLIEGGRTGWNLCDVYLAVVGPADLGP
jgi:glycerate-2-kinase